MKSAQFIKLIFVVIGTLLLFSCSVTKHVPENEYLLNSVDIVHDKDRATAKKAYSYVRQRPNSKWLNTFRLPLYIYSSSGSDTTKWNNRFLRRIGEEPVIYSRRKAEQTQFNIEQMMRNDGYLHATVDFEERISHKDNRKDLIYYLHEGLRYRIDSVNTRIDNNDIARIVEENSSASHIRSGEYFSIEALEAERSRITSLLKEVGYYKFTKDLITFVADTAKNSLGVNLTMNILATDDVSRQAFKLYRINRVVFVSDPSIFNRQTKETVDTIAWGAYTMLCYEKPAVHRKMLESSTYIEPGELYCQSNVNRTYNSFAQLSALRYTSVHIEECPDTALLDCYIIFEKNKRYSAGAEFEVINTKKGGGTDSFSFTLDDFLNSLGASASVAFSNRNLFSGSELLSLRLSWAWENISDLSEYLRNEYIEYDAELSLRFYKGIFSWLLPSQKNLLKSSSLVSLKFNSQRRPEYDRLNMALSVGYTWSRSPRSSHKLEIPGINCIRVPWIDNKFKEEYLDSISSRNSILKYNYENLLITKAGYTYEYTSAVDDRYRNDAFRMSASIETSGNILGAFNEVLGIKKGNDRKYACWGIAYAQYVKGDLELTKSMNLDNRNSLVAHLGLGIAYPYGNSSVLPFEKRYYAGGANFMRGWLVRTLGPGSYKGNDKNIDYINQTGDLKLNLSVELRSYLFWKLYSALFIDAGNIWTLRNYEEQPGGQFKLRTFCEDLALSYGMGLRMSFDQFMLRVDAGMKAVNPALRGKDKYPIIRPRLGRDFALHIAVGYPF